LSAVLFLAVLAFIFSDPLLRALGNLLVVNEPPQKADLVEVLGGDYRGDRILKGCELVRNGFAPHALVTGSAGFFGILESQGAVQFAVRHGCPESYFIIGDYAALSTTDEVIDIVPRLRRLNARKILLVTSPTHTARALRVFHRYAPGIEVHPVAADDPFWNGGLWWKSREGRKRWLLEATKTVADYLRL